MQAPAVAAKPTAKYVPPSMREGGNRRGESMNPKGQRGLRHYDPFTLTTMCLDKLWYCWLMSKILNIVLISCVFYKVIFCYYFGVQMKPLLSESLICRKILVKLIYRICSDRSGRFREFIWQKTKILDNPRYNALWYRIRLLVALIIVCAHDSLA